MTIPRRLTRIAVAGTAFFMLCGFQSLFGGQGLGVNGGGPDHPDDPRWEQFRGVKVVADKQRGVLTAQFPKDLKKADGQVMDLGGYVMPLENNMNTAHFILTRRSSGCPFCPPNEANEALEVFLKTKIRYEQRQFYVKGRLKLVSNSNQGLFFQLVDASAS